SWKQHMAIEIMPMNAPLIATSSVCAGSSERLTSAMISLKRFTAWATASRMRAQPGLDVESDLHSASRLRSAGTAAHLTKLPENREDRLVGEARRITRALVDLADNVQGQLSAHAVTVSELNGKKIARTIECVPHDAQGVGIIDTPDTTRWGHFVLLS